MLTSLLASVLMPAAGGLPPSRVSEPGLLWDLLALALNPLAASGYAPGHDKDTP